MANYTAADVKKLRELTGSGMLDCKKALDETEGDFDKAVEILRVKGAKDVGKRAERNALEGLIAVSGNTMVEVNAETDFVAKNAEFKDVAARIAEAAAAVKANSAEELAAADVDGTPAADVLQELSAKIGEKLELRRAVTVEGEHVSTYLHQRSADLPPAVGVLVAYTGEGEEAEQAAHAIAMQVAALKAQYLSRESVPAEVVDKERSIAEQITREEGKPEQAIPKIVEGRLGGFYKDVVLLEQPSVADSKKTVKQIADAAGITVTDFARFEVGQH
ncbi:translation elongation factor Ts [Corynebacterium uberis]|uniref:translation elongation factor Ts n=1 Tax=Corynebacterium TaxID=1716 RepID=UPI001D0A6400|nr:MULTISPECIES: translation elongation factor Ts [Corynebacterium]MCZ9308416.1 translation elongation factor Ts [Corynebacterium sp. c6VSa_13]UDL74086.1 translation elongation factor Ts [Corynebacterium uberis]UDL75030.1 translation elongation factor Ts [Corynebacterium uberis]UDL77244.1 translation elongation factor Ts [Corynebacterium uberis]UDL79527.1 translation elongation factor Ts [Corynebacterium uberis]